MKKFSYEPKVTTLIRQIISGFTDEKVHTFIIDNYDVCPFCEKQFRSMNGVITNVGTISAFIPENTKDVYLYALCKPCSKHKPTKEQSQRAEDYIYSKLN